MSEAASPIVVFVNGAPQHVAAGASLVDLLVSNGIAADRKGVAVAVNGSVVRRADWAGTALHAGCAVEIVTAKQGG